jgi:hypothetical protein
VHIIVSTAQSRIKHYVAPGLESVRIAEIYLDNGSFSSTSLLFSGVIILNITMMAAVSSRGGNGDGLTFAACAC